MLAKAPYYVIIGWIGLVATLGMLGSLLVEWSVVLGWVVLVSTTIYFYVSTIEADYVECEWASFVLIPFSLLMLMAGVEPINYIVSALGLLCLLYGLAEYFALSIPFLSNLLHAPERRAAARLKRETRLNLLREYRARMEELESQRAAQKLHDELYT